MTAECRPPPGTPDGTVCVLEVDATVDGEDVTAHVNLRWNNQRWENRNGLHIPLSSEFRFHSIATPPEGEG